MLYITCITSQTTTQKETKGVRNISLWLMVQECSPDSHTQPYKYIYTKHIYRYNITVLHLSKNITITNQLTSSSTTHDYIPIYITSYTCTMQWTQTISNYACGAIITSHKCVTASNTQSSLGDIPLAHLTRRINHQGLVGIAEPRKIHPMHTMAETGTSKPHYPQGLVPKLLHKRSFPGMYSITYSSQITFTFTLCIWCMSHKTLCISISIISECKTHLHTLHITSHFQFQHLITSHFHILHFHNTSHHITI